MGRGNFFRGDVYTAKWIIESIKSGQLLEKDDFFRYVNPEEGAKRLDFGRNKP